MQGGIQPSQCRYWATQEGRWQGQCREGEAIAAPAGSQGTALSCVFFTPPIPFPPHFRLHQGPA